MRASLLLLLLALPFESRAQVIIGARDSLTARVDRVFSPFDRTDSPGCAIGVYFEGRILYARGYGMANLELGVPITPRTVFNIGSISKQFTALAVLLLAQEGKLSLEDPVSRYFSEMPPYASGITVRQMLNHTGGLRDYMALLALSGRSWEGVGDTFDYLRLITRSAETNFPPGERYQYSNSGYVLAGQLVYRGSGRSLAAFLQERVFDPLGMADTRLFDDHTLIIRGRAQGYAPRGNGFRIDMPQFDETGDGGVQTTVEDFARWDRNWDSATVGGRALVESLVVPGRLGNGSTIAYALGVGLSTYRGLRTVAHGGVDEGYRAKYLRFPDQKLSVACFCNLSTADPDDLAKEVAAVYLGAQMTHEAWEIAVRAAPAVAVPVEELRRLAGLWRNTETGEMGRSRVEGNSLVVLEDTRLVPLGGNRFRRDPGEEWVFDGDGSGRPRRQRIRTPGAGTTTWERVDVVRLTGAQLAEYAGEYRSEEIETTYSLAADTAVADRGGEVTTGLTVRIGGRRLWTLEPIGRDVFVAVIPGLDDGALFEFKRDAHGPTTGFAIQTWGVRNLKFARRQ